MFSALYQNNDIYDCPAFTHFSSDVFKQTSLKLAYQVTPFPNTDTLRHNYNNSFPKYRHIKT